MSIFIDDAARVDDDYEEDEEDEEEMEQDEEVSMGVDKGKAKAGGSQEEYECMLLSFFFFPFGSNFWSLLQRRIWTTMRRVNSLPTTSACWTLSRRVLSRERPYCRDTSALTSVRRQRFWPTRSPNAIAL